MSGKAKTRKTFGSKLKDQQNDNKTFYNLANQGTVMSSSNSLITGGSVGGGTVNTFAESDLEMNTYDIVGVDRLKFAIREGAGNELTSDDYGIEAVYNSNVAYGMQFKIPATKSYYIMSGSAQVAFSDVAGLITGQSIKGGSLETGTYLDVANIASPANPTSNYVRLFADEDNSDHLTVRRSDGSEVDLEGATSGANTTLSNLGTTAINADLDPASDNVSCLGSSTKRWDKLFTGDVWTTYLTGNTDGEIKLVGDFVPFDDDTWDLGSSTKKWQRLYVNTCNLDVITAGIITVTTFSTTGITNLGNGDTDQVNFYGKTDWKTNVTSSSATTGSREGYITIKINGTDKKLYYYA